MMMFGAGIELFHVAVPAALAGKTLEACAIGATCGANVIAVQHAGKIETGLGPETPLPAGGELLMLGTHEQREHFFRAFG